MPVIRHYGTIMDKNKTISSRPFIGAQIRNQQSQDRDIDSYAAEEYHKRNCPPTGIGGDIWNQKVRRDGKGKERRQCKHTAGDDIEVLLAVAYKSGNEHAESIEQSHICQACEYDL